MLRQHTTAITVCLACATTVMGHWWIVRHAEQQSERWESSHRDRAPKWGCLESPDSAELMRSLPDEPPQDDSEPRLLMTATFESALVDEDQPADASRLSIGHQATAPARVERRMTRRQHDDQSAVRAVIDEEMSEASAEERDIWFEELKSLPAEVVRDLLQVRRQLRVLSPDHPLSKPGQLPPPALPVISRDMRPLDVEQVTQSRTVRSGDWSASRQALEQAIAWSTHNLANAATPGYKRIECLFSDVYTADRTDESAGVETNLIGLGCRLKPLRIDMTAGELKETGRNLDLAIDGSGLFLLQAEQSADELYTRCGRLTVDDKRRLCVIHEDAAWLLQPVISLPENAVAWQISSDGVVSVSTADKPDGHPIGRIQLSLFTDPSRLIPVGDALFAAPTIMPSRRMEPGMPATGLIRQGYLEQSNVDAEREHAERETWESILQALPAAEFPRTARERTGSPK